MSHVRSFVWIPQSLGRTIAKLTVKHSLLQSGTEKYKGRSITGCEFERCRKPFANCFYHICKILMAKTLFSRERISVALQIAERFFRLQQEPRWRFHCFLSRKKIPMGSTEQTDLGMPIIDLTADEQRGCSPDQDPLNTKGMRAVHALLEPAACLWCPNEHTNIRLLHHVDHKNVRNDSLHG